MRGKGMPVAADDLQSAAQGLQHGESYRELPPEENRKARLFDSMAGVLAANYDGVVLKKNVPRYTPQHLGDRIESVGIFYRHKLAGVRLVDPNCTAVELMQDISGVFRGAAERAGL